MDYKVSDLRSVEADRIIYKPFPNHQLERETKNIILCWKHFTNYFIGVKKKNHRYSCSDYMVIYVGKNRQHVETKTGLRPVKANRLICKTFPNNFNREIKTSFSVE